MRMRMSNKNVLCNLKSFNTLYYVAVFVCTPLRAPVFQYPSVQNFVDKQYNTIVVILHHLTPGGRWLQILIKMFSIIFTLSFLVSHVIYCGHFVIWLPLSSRYFPPSFQ